MAKEYKETPASFVGLEDPYEAYCFNEACYYIRVELEVTDANGKSREPYFKQETAAPTHNNQNVIEFLTQQRSTVVKRSEEPKSTQ